MLHLVDEMLTSVGVSNLHNGGLRREQSFRVGLRLEVWRDDFASENVLGCYGIMSRVEEG